MEERAKGRGEAAIIFARNFFKHPKMLGSLIPSSRFLVGQLLRRIDWSTARVIVEYGPGVGTFTKEILRRMRSDATLLVFETNADFVRHLRENFKDSRLHVIEGSATEVDHVIADRNLGEADYVISGIPFSIMPDGDREKVLRKTHDVLREGGAFLVYQFSTQVLGDLRRMFSRVDQDFELLNILPARLFFCVKNGSEGIDEDVVPVAAAK